MKKLLKTCLAALAWGCLALPGNAQERPEMDLSGEWAFQTDLMDFRRGSLDVRYCHRLQGTFTLPGITDDYQIGYKSPYRHRDRLTRKYEYMGPAWYQREMTIPAAWKGKRIFMYFERTHWLSSVYVGAKEVSRLDYVSVPHCHDLTKHVTPGKPQLFTVCIDNRYQYDTHKWDHAHTEFTQINWNGILGEIKFFAVAPVYIGDMQVYPDAAARSVKVRLQVRNCTRKPVEGQMAFRISGKDGLEAGFDFPVNLGKDSVSTVEHTLPMGKKAQLWDEFNPALYAVKCRLATTDGKKDYADSREATFGLRDVRQGEDHILINGHPIHLRGTVENAVFPKTGHAPVDEASWERVFTILKDYGMNHMRFHSWCPPDAAFRAADRLGVYLEVEMPMWGKDAEPDEDRYDFFRREQLAILKEYGNHPSFLLYCNGNEITGNFGFIEELTRRGRESDPRRLFSGSTARARVKSDQFYISQSTQKGHCAVYEGRPYTDWDKNDVMGVGLPIIGHESGQRCMYPNFREIPNFDGPVEARNFELFRESLEANGMLDQADDFYRASGAQTVLEYKDAFEGLLRTDLQAGFQLLSLNDFTGQGYAPVGVLDPFWNSKGFITPEKFREFCAPTVALLRFARRAWYGGETFTGKAEVYNYSTSGLKNARLKWWVTDEAGNVLADGRLKPKTLPNYAVTPVGGFSYVLPQSDKPRKLEVHLSVGGKVHNSWTLWVYPRNPELLRSTDEVLYTTSFDDRARKQLAAGRTVVFYPDPKQVKGRKSVFHNHFWNPIMFKWAPMTLGCLIHTGCGAFDNFVTDRHLDWQWWDIVTNAKVISFAGAPRELRPFIQTIDSYETNEKLGIAFEARVGGGKLLVMAIDTKKDMDQRPATRQLLQSIDRYVKGGTFDPKVEVGEEFIRSFLK